MGKIIQSDGNGSYIVKKVAAHVLGYLLTLLIGGLIWYITLDRSSALTRITITEQRIQALEAVVPQIGNDVETILLNQRRAAERSGVEFIEPPIPSKRYNLKKEQP